MVMYLQPPLSTRHTHNHMHTHSNSIHSTPTSSDPSTGWSCHRCRKPPTCHPAHATSHIALLHAPACAQQKHTLPAHPTPHTDSTTCTTLCTTHPLLRSLTRGPRHPLLHHTYLPKHYTPPQTNYGRPMQDSPAHALTHRPARTQRI